MVDNSGTDLVSATESNPITDTDPLDLNGAENGNDPVNLPGVPQGNPESAKVGFGYTGGTFASLFSNSTNRAESDVTLTLQEIDRRNRTFIVRRAPINCSTELIINSVSTQMGRAPKELFESVLRDPKEWRRFYLTFTTLANKNMVETRGFHIGDLHIKPSDGSITGYIPHPPYFVDQATMTNLLARYGAVTKTAFVSTPDGVRVAGLKFSILLTPGLSRPREIKYGDVIMTVRYSDDRRICSHCKSFGHTIGHCQKRLSQRSRDVGDETTPDEVAAAKVTVPGAGSSMKNNPDTNWRQVKRGRRKMTDETNPAPKKIAVTPEELNDGENEDEAEKEDIADEEDPEDDEEVNAGKNEDEVEEEDFVVEVPDDEKEGDSDNNSNHTARDGTPESMDEDLGVKPDDSDAQPPNEATQECYVYPPDAEKAIIAMPKEIVEKLKEAYTKHKIDYKEPFIETYLVRMKTKSKRKLEHKTMLQKITYRHKIEGRKQYEFSPYSNPMIQNVVYKDNTTTEIFFKIKKKIEIIAIIQHLIQCIAFYDADIKEISFYKIEEQKQIKDDEISMELMTLYKELEERYFLHPNDTHDSEEEMENGEVSDESDEEDEDESPLIQNFDPANDAFPQKETHLTEPLLRHVTEALQNIKYDDAAIITCTKLQFYMDITKQGLITENIVRNIW